LSPLFLPIIFDELKNSIVLEKKMFGTLRVTLSIRYGSLLNVFSKKEKRKKTTETC
jgi:hypothetical protein